MTYRRQFVRKIDGTTLVDCRLAKYLAPGTDLLGSSNATADQRTEANATTGWTGSNAALSSVTTPTPIAGTYCMKILGNGGAGTVGAARQSITTVADTKYRIRAAIYTEADITTQVQIRVGTAAGGSQIAAFDIPMTEGWNVVELDFAATGTTTHITIYGADNGYALYADDISVWKAVLRRGRTTPQYLYPKAFLVVTAWTHGTDVLKISDRAGAETSLSNAASKGFAAGTVYEAPEITQFRSSSTNESGFEIICFY